jgi:Na+-transporting methylmalonyl-CoA/oxaloacetate decarboxylase gamma subunit
MTAIVPDTLQGALIVSVIDFFLSFLIISGIGVVLSFFPLLNRVAQFIERPAHAPSHATKVPDTKASHANKEALDEIAAIAAAVAVIMDGSPHRIIHIEPSRRSWATEGRIAQHSSHSPR